MTNKHHVSTYLADADYKKLQAIAKTLGVTLSVALAKLVQGTKI